MATIIPIGEIKVKRHDTFGHEVLTAKSGSSGPMGVDKYKRPQEKNIKEGEDESLEQEYEAKVLVTTIIGEIETWAGESLEEMLKMEIERGLDEKISAYAHRLAELLGKNEELKNDSTVVGWIHQLEEIK
ncbi:MAG TPA: hypothetical protein PLK76_04100 [bacterium]|nr:hypothetical protein [bacterium]